MSPFTPAARLSFCLASLASIALVVSHLAGLINDPQEVARERIRFGEMAAVALTRVTDDAEHNTLRQTFHSLMGKYPDLISAAIVDADGTVLTRVGQHVVEPPEALQVTEATHLQFPIHRDNNVTFKLDMDFHPIGGGLFAGTISRSFGFSLLLFLWGATVVNWLIVQRFLRSLDPLRVMPEQVQSAANQLQEGLVYVDHRGFITLVNEAFSNWIGADPPVLIGQNLSEFSWDCGDADGVATLPWQKVLSEQKPASAHIRLERAGRDRMTFSASATPLNSSNSAVGGVLCTFIDITALESRRQELTRLMDVVRKSSEEIRRQNRELERLSHQDPLTGVLDRRTLLERLEAFWQGAVRHDHACCALLIDIDFFKQINERHGHDVGDQVLIQIANVLNSAIRKEDHLGRYSGEEFLVILPYLDRLQGQLAAERFRQLVEALRFDNFKVTCSIGVAERRPGMASFQSLLEQAEEGLVLAKDRGRNQVAISESAGRYAILDPEEQPATPIAKASEHPGGSLPARPAGSISYHAVASLVAALASRDFATAEHCRRVADLCVLMAEGLMPRRDTYILETAGLLHDIGKLGVPDTILLKPGQLTEEEWEIMSRHDRLGVEIVRSTFGCESLTEIVANHHRSRTLLKPDQPRQHRSLGARILEIADAYDAMRFGGTYRSARTPVEAFEELRKCSDTQFDAELVERFISLMQSRGTNAPIRTLDVTQVAALEIGLQMESFVNALDDYDIPGVRAIAEHLSQVAEHHQLVPISATSKRLILSIEEEDLVSILYGANELIELCRSTQHPKVLVNG